MTIDSNSIFKNSVISPYAELIAYEYLWTKRNTSLKSLSESLSVRGRYPSQIVEDENGFIEPPEYPLIREYIQSKLNNFSIVLKEDIQYPQNLLDAKYPVNLMYYRGDIGLLNAPSVSIVGTRKISDEGIKRCRKLTALLCENNYAVVSGLARGVDTIALNTAIERGGYVIGVIGTPIDRYYPKENEILQETIAQSHLLISHVPLYKYSIQAFKTKPYYFPERNAIMSAISQATVIVEASDSSGSLTQARACLEQGRRLFILNSCFENPRCTWPSEFEKKGAVRVNNFETILEHLQSKK